MFTLAAFEPTDEEIARVTGTDLEMEEIDTAKSELSGDDSEGEDNKPVKMKQKNRAVIEDSDDEEDKKEEEKKVGMSLKKLGKQKELPGWMAQQEPSTKYVPFPLSSPSLLNFVLIDVVG